MAGVARNDRAVHVGSFTSYALWLSWVGDMTANRNGMTDLELDSRHRKGSMVDVLLNSLGTTPQFHGHLWQTCPLVLDAGTVCGFEYSRQHRSGEITFVRM